MFDNITFDVLLLTLVLVGGAVAMDRIWRVRRIAALKRSHRRVAAKVKQVSHSFAYSGRGLYSRWHIEADWFDQATDTTHHFKSDPLDRDDAMRYAEGDPITVLVDPSDPSRYYVEIAR